MKYKRKFVDDRDTRFLEKNFGFFFGGGGGTVSFHIAALSMYFIFANFI